MTVIDKTFHDMGYKKTLLFYFSLSHHVLILSYHLSYLVTVTVTGHTGTQTHHLISSPDLSHDQSHVRLYITVDLTTNHIVSYITVDLFLFLPYALPFLFLNSIAK
jgi:hypothetical protein